MAKFKFHLESVEKVRIQKEQRMLQELAQAQRVYQEKISVKRDLLNKKKDAISAKNNLHQAVMNVQSIALSEDYIEGLKYHLIRADQAILRARRFLDQAMRNYIVSRRERMMIDRLKEKALEEYKKEQSKKAQKQLDDLMVMRDRMKSGFGTEEELT